jgi:hypothetical protein
MDNTILYGPHGEKCVCSGLCWPLWLAASKARLAQILAEMTPEIEAELRRMIDDVLATHAASELFPAPAVISKGMRVQFHSTVRKAVVLALQSNLPLKPHRFLEPIENKIPIGGPGFFSSSLRSR